MKNKFAAACSKLTLELRSGSALPRYSRKKSSMSCSWHIVLPFSSVCVLGNCLCPTFHKWHSIACWDECHNRGYFPQGVPVRIMTTLQYVIDVLQRLDKVGEILRKLQSNMLHLLMAVLSYVLCDAWIRLYMCLNTTFMTLSQIAYELM